MRQSLIRTAWRMTPLKRQLKSAYYSRLNPIYWAQLARACRTLGFDFGLLNSLVRAASVSGTGEPIPWYSYPATEFLKQLDFTSRTVFEYGSGNSTLFWSRRASRVVSVEHVRDWYEQVRAAAPANCELLYEPAAERYVDAVHQKGERYDVIVIDGQSRLRCAPEAISRLNDGGLIILDNSDWFPATSKTLRHSGLLEVDFFGFGPISDYTTATSLYFHRQFRQQPVSGRQPVPGIGALPNSFDEAFWKN